MTREIEACKRANNHMVQRAVIKAVVVGVVLSGIFVVVSYVIGSSKEQAGALVGFGLSLIVTLPALITGFWGVRGGPGTLAISVLGTWLIKMGGLILVVLLIRNESWLSMPWAGVGLLVGAVVPTIAEIILLLRERPKLEV